MISSHTWWRFGLLFLLSLVIVLLIDNIWAVEAAPLQMTQISESARRQMTALESEKRSRSPAQRKIDSQLLYELKKYRGQAIAQGFPNMKTGIEIDKGGRVLVDIKARVTDGLLKKIESYGGKIINSFAEYNAIRAIIPLRQVEGLARLNDVKFIQPALKVKTSSEAISP